MQTQSINRPINNQDDKLAWTISLVIVCVFLVNLSAGISEVIGIEATVVSLILKIFIAVIMVMNLGVIIERLSRSMLIFVLISVAVSLLNILLFPQNNKFFYYTLVDYWSICVPLSIFLWAVDDYKTLFQKLINISLCIAIVAVIVISYLLFVKNILFNEGIYSMGFSYACIFPCAVLLWDYVENKTRVSLIGYILLLLIIIAFGSRGALLCILIYTVVLVLKKHSKDKLYLKLVVIITAMILILFNDMILLELQKILLKFDINSRTIALLLNDTTNLSGREVIYKTVYKNFLFNPLYVHGINADYLLIGKYTHNIVLELLYEFGILLSFPLLVVIGYFSWRSIFYFERNAENDFKTILFCVAMPALMVSGTLWTSYLFWMWIVINIKTNKNNELV